MRPRPATTDAVPHGSTMSIERVEFLDGAGRSTPVGTTLEPLTIRLHWRANEPVEAPLFSFVVWTETGQAIANPGMLPPHAEGGPVYEGEGFVDYRIERSAALAGCVQHHGGRARPTTP